MSVTYKLIDDEHFPDGVEVVGAASLPRVGDSVSVMVYVGDKQIPLVDRVVTEVSHKIQRTGLVDGRDSAVALAPAEVVLGKHSDPAFFAAMHREVRAIDHLIKGRESLYARAKVLLAELQANIGPEPFIDCSDNCDEYSSTKHIETCPNKAGKKLPSGARARVRALATAPRRRGASSPMSSGVCAASSFTRWSRRRATRHCATTVDVRTRRRATSCTTLC